MRVAVNYQDYSDIDVETGILRAAFPDVEIVESYAALPDEFIAEAAGVHGALIQYAHVTEEVVDAMPECLGYVRYGVGYDNIDAAYAWSKGKKVAYVPHYCIDEVSNHAVAMVLALNRKLFVCDRLMREDEWHVDKVRPCPRLSDCTVGIVAIGNIGKRAADKLSAFAARVIFYDPYVDSYAGCEKVDDLGALFAQADYVSLHLPLTDETRGMIGGEQFERMKPTACLVNTGRGATVIEAELVEALCA